MSNKAKIREDAKGLNPIDDPLFMKMSEDKDFCQEIIQVLLDDINISVIENRPQFAARNLEGRSCILDLFCRLGNGKLVNIEVQKADDDDHQRRMRYNAALLTTNTSNPGTKFREIHDVIVILISKFDIFKKGKAVYHVDRMIRETNELVENGLCEIYVNSEVDDKTKTAELMKVFNIDDEYNDKLFPETSSRKRRYKTTEEGVNEMCEILEKYRNEGIIEGAQKEKVNSIRALMKNLNMTAEKAMAALNIAPSDFKIYISML